LKSKLFCTRGKPKLAQITKVNILTQKNIINVGGDNKEIL